MWIHLHLNLPSGNSCFQDSDFIEKIKLIIFSISDDWECSKLQLNQRTYAANDATASLDIFVALVFASVTGHPLPFDMSFDVDYLLKKYASELEIAVNELLDKEFKQTKEDMTKIYKLVEKTDPDLDIKAYYTKPSSTKS